MQGKFETKVQTTLDELRLQPSPPVWEKIETEIREEKKRRRGLFWFFLAAGLLAGGAWWLYNEMKQPASPTAQTSVRKAEKKNTSLRPAVDSPTAPFGSKKREVQTPETSAAGLPFATQTNAPNNVFSKLANRSGKESAPTIQPGDEAIAIGRTTVVNQSPTSSTTNKAENSKPGTPLIKEVITTTPSALDTVQTDRPSLSAAGTDSVKNEPAPAVLPLRNDSSAKRKIASVKKWRLQAGLDAGGSWMVEGLSLAPLAARDVALFNAASPGSSSQRPSQASAKTKGLALAAGLHLAKKLNTHWELQVGLQYRYASVHQRVGEKKTADTTVSFAQDRIAANGFYTNTATHDYTNAFHFLELPVTVSYKLARRLPLYGSAGAVYSRLLSTTALSYSPASNLYFKNSGAYNHNAVSLSASLQAGFFEKKKLALRTGPFAQYALSGIEKQSSKASHFFFAGLRTALIF